MKREGVGGVILLTGAAGFLGTWIAKELIAGTDARLIALVRAADEQAAGRRLKRAWWDHPELSREIGRRIRALAGDVSRPGLGLSPEDYEGLSVEITHIIHAAADLRLHASLEELRRTNVQGTSNVLALARAAHRHHGLAGLAHVSTAYVAGRRRGEVREEDLTDAYGFASNYEHSKYEAEILVRAAMAELPVSVFRPGMVVGDSRTGEVKTFNTLYFPLRLYLSGRYRVLPMRPALRVNLVPVDYVAASIARLAVDPAAAGLTFHLTAPYESLPTAAELTAFVRGWARQNLGVTLPRPVFLPVPLPRRRGGEKGPAGKLSGLAAYLAERRIFNRDNLDRLCGPYSFDWRAYLPKLLSYAARHGFMHRSERTVHEQILFRLGSKSRPAVYHDIIGGEVLTRSASELRGEIERAAASLRAYGIRPGDRVGIVGLNGTRHFALDTAIGLIGAVNVPLYYTSPPAEIEAILADSGAKLLLAGAPALLPDLNRLAAMLPVVSFCRAPLPKGTGAVIPWEKFLADGARADAASSAPVDPDDPATIRYTSGTTGRPKGVVFTHRQLRWLAEAVAALPPWTVRHNPVRYLSFLPLSHVVEGILGAYAPYYAPARLDLYHLADFRALAAALPKARPTFFFCVPRFYERLWERITGHVLGRRWLSAPQSLLGRLLRPLVRRAVLRRAGLDRCGYLVVGSAPVSDELLQSLAGLGIDVHNAYGLTEAPLLTINRPGRIRAGTVGEPLPETEVRTAADGEILVRGPQVAKGYHGAAAAEGAHRDGWFCTGDLGRLTEEGGLVVEGRKKELIVTSYGKNIAPLKIETRLRRLPGVLEAMLVGEGRPYCAALLWMEAGAAKETSWDEFDRSVGALAGELAHPEQPRSWAVLPYDLTVDAGDLTANLKLRRETVARKLADVLAALYGAGEIPGKVFHLGRAGS